MISRAGGNPALFCAVFRRALFVKTGRSRRVKNDWKYHNKNKLFTIVLTSGKSMAILRQKIKTSTSKEVAYVPGMRLHPLQEVRRADRRRGL